MSEKVTIARPYAKAVFAFAVANKQIPQWSALLQAAAMVVMDPQMTELMRNPRVSTTDLGAVILAVCHKVLHETGQNFIQLLVANQRLSIIPEIATLYESYRADLEKTIAVQVISVLPISKPMRDKLEQVLRIRLQRDVLLECHVDSSLLGGAVIRAGDLVIDGSVRSKLAKLGRAMQA